MIEKNLMKILPNGTRNECGPGKPCLQHLPLLEKSPLFPSLPLNHTSNYCEIYSEKCNEELYFTSLKLEDNSLAASILECSANLQVSWPH